MAKRLPTILPYLNQDQAIETTKIHSIAGQTQLEHIIQIPPFRAPHHTISDVALVGGGGYPQPGEISLAHNGVLFLDELPEFKRKVLEVLRQPLEDGKIIISRAKSSIEYPANFMLIASMNPCPCGYFNHPHKKCRCTPLMVESYLNKISGPLLDRIDMHVEVQPVEFEVLTSQEIKENSSEIRMRVKKARRIQEERYKEEGIYLNATMTKAHLSKYCQVDNASYQLLKDAIQLFQLSGRAFDRILKLARTIADLSESETIQVEHVSEAIQYRTLDKGK